MSTATTAETEAAPLAVCRHCGAHLTHEGPLLVDVASGDDGGTYDVCPSSRDRLGPHTPDTRVTPMEDVEVGDVLWESGLRCLVTEVETRPHPHADGGSVVIARTRILNTGWLAHDEGGRYLFGGIIALDGSSGWTFQGIPSRGVAREEPA